MTRTKTLLITFIACALLLVVFGAFLLSTQPAKSSPIAHFPAQDTRYQLSNLRGSADYLVWQQNSMDTASQRFIDGSFDILGFDLKAGKPITIAYIPCDQYIWGMSGPLVVWQSDKEPCQSGEQETLLRNLDTGTTYEIISTEPVFYPATDGKSVTWIELNATGTRLMLKDLDTNQITEIKSLSR